MGVSTPTDGVWGLSLKVISTHRSQGSRGSDVSLKVTLHKEITSLRVWGYGQLLSRFRVNSQPQIVDTLLRAVKVKTFLTA